LKGRFEHLRMFYSGWANTFANTTTLSRILALWNGKNMTFDNQWWTWRWRASFRPSNAMLWWEFLFRLGSMMVLGPNRTNNWHFYNLPFTSWKLIKLEAICHFLFIADFEDFWTPNLS
jgi:hypothetical protein